ncbi:MAG: hypothetical protein HYV26_01835 [Candidatus Hydrogenedentes bacterium]|nr:hypothetical protein [Candidatus Hydrogenedentota bacterium]
MPKKTIWKDPVVEEIHQIREEILREAGGDIHALGRWLMEKQKRYGDKLVTRPPKRLKKEV